MFFRKKLFMLIFFFIVFLLTFFGVYYIFSIKNAKPEIKIDPAKYSLGEIKAGDMTEKDFIIYNKGNKPLDIKHIQSSCECLSVKLFNSNNDNKILPSRSAVLRAMLDTSDFIDSPLETFTFNIIVDSNDKQNP